MYVCVRVCDIFALVCLCVLFLRVCAATVTTVIEMAHNSWGVCASVSV